MMKQYKDVIGRCVCYADARTGLLEQKYGKVKMRTTVSLGNEYVVERDGIVTILKRVDRVDFQVISYKKTA